jgi:hypothetical protein
MITWTRVAHDAKVLTLVGNVWFMLVGAFLMLPDLSVICSRTGYRTADFVVTKTVFWQSQGETAFHAEGSIDGTNELFALEQLAGFTPDSRQEAERYAAPGQHIPVLYNPAMNCNVLQYRVILWRPDFPRMFVRRVLLFGLPISLTPLCLGIALWTTAALKMRGERLPTAR